jgi:hypothetical protein
MDHSKHPVTQGRYYTCDYADTKQWMILDIEIVIKPLKTDIQMPGSFQDETGSHVKD